MALALTSIARADDPKPSDSKAKSSDTTTIHGIVAGVTVEGEMIVDPIAKKIIEADSVFLTVVGMPGNFHHASDKDANKDKDSGNKDSGNKDSGNKDSGNKDSGNVSAEKAERRANVYMVWLSPKTKVCSCCDDSGKETAKKECNIDKLEVGDRVEITYSRREGSAANLVGHLTDLMKSKHGRRRIQAVDAQEVTILPAMHEGSSSSSAKSGDSK